LSAALINAAFLVVALLLTFVVVVVGYLSVN